MKSLKKCIASNISIASEELDQIAQAFKARDLDKGDYLLRSGQECREMAYIESGYLRIYDIAEGNEITLFIGNADSFITSLSSFVLGTPNYWNIQAITDARIAVISRERHQKLLGEVPKWLEFDNLILTRAFAMLEQRMFAQLHTTAGERYDALMADRPEIFNHVPLQYIASMLGIQPETLSRLRNRKNPATS